MYLKFITFFILISQTVFGTYAVVTFIPSELEYVKKHFHNPKQIRIDNINYYTAEVAGKPVVLCCSGYGTTNSAATVSHLIQKFKPQGVICCGVAGGTDLSLQLGDVVIGEKAFEAEIQGLHEALLGTPFTQDSLHPSREKSLPSEFFADEKLLELASSVVAPFTLRKGTLATAQTYPAPKDLYSSILSRKSNAIDMESSAVYQTCWVFETPALVIRGVSNKLNEQGDDVGGYDVEKAIENATHVLTKLLEVLPSETK